GRDHGVAGSIGQLVALELPGLARLQGDRLGLGVAFVPIPPFTHDANHDGDRFRAYVRDRKLSDPVVLVFLRRRLAHRELIGRVLRPGFGVGLAPVAGVGPIATVAAAAIPPARVDRVTGAAGIARVTGVTGIAGIAGV